MLLKYLIGLWLFITAAILNLQGEFVLSTIVALGAVILLGKLLRETLCGK